MRRIEKIVSLEPMTSRLPSVWPSLPSDTSSSIIYFDEDSISGRGMSHTSNWGLLPLNLVFENDPSSSDEVKLLSGTCADGGFILSFENLSKWYHFFVEYYNLLKKYGHCNMVYTSAVDFYTNEFVNGYSNDMKYGGDINTYIELDEIFSKRGGKVNAITEDGTDIIIDVKDDGFFKWICENVVPTFEIPNELTNYWNRNILFYPDVITWLGWFEHRIEQYNDIEKYECSGATDCCDCNEFFNRGGKDMYNSLKEWYNAVQDKIKDNKELIENSLHSCDLWYPNVITEIEIQAPADNLGEMSIFSKDYELGEDYRTIKTYINDNVNETIIEYDGGNVHSGTVSTIDSIPMILSGEDSYNFSNVFMEKYVSKCGDCGCEGVFFDKCPKCGSRNIIIENWATYTEEYLKKEGDIFINNAKKYTFDENNVKIIGHGENADNEIISSLTKTYTIETSEFGWLLFGTVLYEIEKGEYGKYDKNNEYFSGKTFIVFRDETTNTPYTYINGKKVYGELYLPKNVFYFPFFKNENVDSIKRDDFDINDYKQFGRLPIGDDVKYFIRYNNEFIILADNIESSSTIEVLGIERKRITGLSIDENSVKLYCHNGKVFYYDNSYYTSDLVEYTKEGYEPADISDGTITFKPIISGDSIFKIYQADVITGTTFSKLQGLKSNNALVDDVGNVIDGLFFPSKGSGIRPRQGDILEPIYQVGNTANIIEMETLADDDNRKYVGDIISEMTFYYKDTNGKVVEDTKVKIDLSSNKTSLSAINESTRIKDEIEGSGITYMTDDIYCDVTYNMGASLFKEWTSENTAFKYVLADEDKYNLGVEYTETVRFVKEQRQYYLVAENNLEKVIPTKRLEPCNHSISYPVYVYTLVQETTLVRNSQYDSDYSVAMANFNAKINLLINNKGDDTYLNVDMERHNNVEIFPTFAEEYRFGVAVRENVDSDIYINRGINSAFERHLKLGEVTSLEALEQYGLGFFDIRS